MRRAEILFPALVVLFVVAVVGAGVFHYDYSWTVMRFPYLVGGLLVALAGWQTWNAWRTGDDEEAAAIAAPADDDAPGTARLLITGLWLLGILLAVQLLGYLAGIPLYLLAYFRAHGERWSTAIALSVGALAVTWIVFIIFLKVRLPVWPIGLG